MNGHRLAVTMVIAVSALAMCGFSQQSITPQYDPNHYVNNDPGWSLLNEATVKADTVKGDFNATFPPDLLSLQGTRFKITGFMMPLEPAPMTAHFALIRRNSACPFCPPNSPTEAIEVFLEEPVKYTGEEIAVKGRLELVSSSEAGLFYRLKRAVVVPET